MSEHVKKTLLPRLRFPRFLDAGEWEKIQLGQCLLKHPEYGINAPAVPYSDNLPTYLRITDISEDGQIRQDQKVSVAKNVTHENYLDVGDVVLARTGASVGKAYKYRPKDGKLVFAGFLIRVKPDVKKLNSELLFHFLSTEQYWHWVQLTSARSGQPGINGNEYSLLPIPLPPTLKEQQKIADCLSSIDELIIAQTQKIAALKDHKKGLMQQLFPAEGETVPKLRFPEFQDAGDWKNHIISDFSKVTTGNKDTQNKVDDGDYPFFVRSQTVERINSFTYDGEAILTSGDGVGVGKNFHYIIGKFDFHQRVYCIYDFKKDVLGKFIYLYFSEHFYRRVMQFNAKNSVDSVRMSAITEMPVMLPKYEEQQKIANSLSSIDDLITTQTQKLEAFKTHKKGLMQQLFPDSLAE